MSSRLSRRRFLQTSAVAATAGFWCGQLQTGKGQDSPNEKLHVGVIGVAAQGRYNLDEARGPGGAAQGRGRIAPGTGAGRACRTGAARAHRTRPSAFPGPNQ